ncbi:MAG: LytR C-terminal domain-containing protein [Brevinematia bacterium]
MIKVDDYRKKTKKPKRIRNWVLVGLIFLMAFISTTFIIKNTKTTKFILPNNVIVNESEVILNFTHIDLESEKVNTIINKVPEIVSYMKIKKPTIKIKLNGELVSRYLLEKPEITILNGKGEKNLAMELSIKLMNKGYNIENYDNYPKIIDKSIIISRIPQKEITENLIRITKIKETTNSIIFEGVKNKTAGIIIILGKDFNLSQVQD